MTIGVYAVVNKVNRKAYIGSSVNVERRLIQHKCAINTRHFIHYEPYAEDARKFTVDDFEFKLIAETNTIQEARTLETACLEFSARDDLYNRALHADGASGVRRDKDHYVGGAKKRLADPLFRQTLSAACKGRRAVIQCPHCSLSGGGGNMRRYHFDNCKQKT